MSKRDETPMGLEDSNGEATDHPVVFISYSHDSSAHKKWVGELEPISKLIFEEIGALQQIQKHQEVENLAENARVGLSVPHAHIC